MKRLILVLPLLLAVAACRSTISYTPFPGVHVGVPVSVSMPHKASLPSGKGGHVKTGNPYRVNGRTYYPMASASGYDEVGIASWYGPKFHGGKTANGERYDMHGLSAAHRTLPLPTLVRVTNLENGRSVVVRVNDRGPFANKGRLIDLSYAAAQSLGFVDKGTARVRVTSLEGTPPTTIASRTPPARIRIEPQVSMYVQLGAFVSPGNAKRLQTKLASSYANISISKVKDGAQNLYRVRIGPFANAQDIESEMLRLQGQGFDSVIVTIE